MTAVVRPRTRTVGRHLLTLCLVAVIIGAATSPAMAGGGWWTSPQLEDGRTVLGIGQTATVSAQVLFRSVAEADAVRAADHPYHAFLVRGIDEAALREAMTQMDPEDWWREPSEAIRLGHLSVQDQDANIVDVSATFTVPAVEPGVYELMLCDADCSTPLADVIPARGIYVGDGAAVEIIHAADETFSVVLDELERVRTGAEVLQTDVADTLGTLDEITSRIAATDTTLLALQQQLDASSDRGGAWLAWTGWAVAGAALLLGFIRPAPHRRPQDRAGPGTTEHPSRGQADDFDVPPGSSPPVRSRPYAEATTGPTADRRRTGGG